MINKPITVKVAYNRYSNLNKDFFKEIIIMATSREVALRIVNNYEEKGMFDTLEDDYVEDSLYAIQY